MKDKWGTERASMTEAIISYIPLKGRIPFVIISYVLVIPLEGFCKFLMRVWDCGLKEAFEDAREYYVEVTKDYWVAVKFLWTAKPEEDGLKTQGEQR